MDQIAHVFAGAKHTEVPVKALVIPKLPLGAHLYYPRTRRWGKLVKVGSNKEVIDLPTNKVPGIYQLKALILAV